MNFRKKLASIILALTSTSAWAQVQDVENSFHERLLLRTKITAENADEIKAKMTAMRYQEEEIAESKFGQGRLKPSEKSGRAFTGPGTLINPAFEKEGVTFKSGDVVLLRGTSSISTTISAMTDSNSQFSHLLMIYIDPNGKALAMEALLDKGVIVHPLEEVLTEGVPRMVLYRHRDAAIAQNAAKIGYDAAEKYILKGQTFPYDMKLDLGNYSEVYCAEFVRMAYDLATQSKVLLPTYPAILGGKFKNTIGSLKANFKPIPTFWPADMDVEPLFEPVAEWRDYRATLNYRIKDQIIISVFDWIEEGSLFFDYSQLAGLAKPKQGGGPTDADKISEVAKKVDQVVNELTNSLLIVNDEQLAKTRRNMTSVEIRKYIESVRDSARVSNLFKRNSFVNIPGCLRAVSPLLKPSF